jgi:glycosyltransferase involved in cell wall biosynthesis
MDKPQVSVVIPTYNRPPQLQRTLEALAAQTLHAALFEVVVVDDGSQASYSAVAARAWPFRVSFLRQANRGEVVARNEGVLRCQGGFLVFMDDDILPDADYLQSLVHEHEDHPGDIILGTLYPKVDEEPTPFQRLMARQDANQAGGEIPYYECWSGVLAVERAIFDGLGGMRPLGDGGRNAWGGMDFGYRADRAGFRIRRCTKAIALHDDRASRDLRLYCRRIRNVSRHAAPFFRRCPGLEPLIPMFRDKTPIHWREDALLLIVRKVARRLASSAPGLWALENTAAVLEVLSPSSGLLLASYRWTIGAHILQGYRAGLRELGTGKTS